MLASTNPFDDDSEFNFDNNPFGSSINSSQNTSSTSQGSGGDADFEASTLIEQVFDTVSFYCFLRQPINIHFTLHYMTFCERFSYFRVGCQFKNFL